MPGRRPERRPERLPVRAVATAREDLDVIVARDPSVRRRREALLHPALPALWTYRLAHALHLRGHRLAARLVGNLGRLASGGVEIHPGATLGRRVFVDHGAGVVIGEMAVVGDDVTIYHQVTLGAVGWWRDNGRAPGARRHPVVGDRVVLGAGATVLGPVLIGDDALIGAGALVTEDVPAGARVTAPPGLVTVRRPGPAAGPTAGPTAGPNAGPTAGPNAGPTPEPDLTLEESIEYAADH